MPPIIAALKGTEPKVLFVRFSSLGDVILTLPAVDSFRRAFPGARISYAVKAAYAPLLEGGRVDRILPLGGRGRGAGLASLAGLCRRAGRQDLVIDLHNSLRSRICRIVAGGEVLAYRKDSVRRRLRSRGIPLPAASYRHVADRYLDTLQEAGIACPVKDPQILPAAQETDEARQLLLSAGVTDPSRTAVFAPGARWPNKEWTPEGFAAVAVDLRRRCGLQPMIVGNDNDLPAAKRLQVLAGEEAVNLAGRTGLRQLAAVLSLAAVFVGNDSGPGHLAAAVGTPTVTLFGPTSESFGFAPRGKAVRTVSLPLECRPCSVHGGTFCRKGRRACLDDIDTASVSRAAEEILRRNGGQDSA